MINTALDYVERGWSVIPLLPEDKRPNFSILPVDPADGRPSWSTYQERPPTEDEIFSWWRRAPRSNVGIVTGAVSGIIVHDADGAEGMAQLQRHGVPRTVTSVTGGGMHLFYQHPGETTANFTDRLPGTDLRADGGYVVAPPSLHPSGRTYQWRTSPDDAEIAPAPGWFVDLMNEGPADQWLATTVTAQPRTNGMIHSENYWTAALGDELKRVAHAAIGNRNNTLVKAAFRMGQFIVEGKLTVEEVEHKLFLVAVATGLTEPETRATIHSGIQAGMLNPRS